jgi:hypothetical protein
MASVWVRWRNSSGEHTEITINDVLGETSLALGEYKCEAFGERHNPKTYIVKTNKGPFVLCRRCCKQIGLPTR